MTSAIVRVEKATSDLLLVPDWTMNIEICDSINLEPGLAKDIVKAVKKRLQHKSSRVQFLTLTLLETMFKNCGDFVHSLVVEKDILPEMVKIVKKKSDMEVRDKILVLLDSCQEAFGGAGGKYPQYFWAYTDLKRSGVEFPLRSGDASLIITPPIHHTAAPVALQARHVTPMRLDQAMASEMSTLSLSDLDRIARVAELLNDMLKAVNRHDHKAIEDEVITDLVDQCRSNQKKVLQLIDLTGDEELLRQGLVLNDDLQSLLAKHEALTSVSLLPSESSVTVQGPITPSTTATNMFEEDEEEEDDEFSQLARRTSKFKPSSNNNEIASSARSSASALPDPPSPITAFPKDVSPKPGITYSPSFPHNPQTYPGNENHNPYGNYVVPWAQPQPSSPMLHFRPEQVLPEPQLPHSPEEALPPGYARYPPPPWEDDLSPNPFTQTTDRFPPHASTIEQQFNLTGTSSVDPPVETGAGTAASPSYRHFEDLRSPNGGMANQWN